MNEEEARKLVRDVSNDEKLGLYTVLKTRKARKAA